MIEWGAIVSAPVEHPEMLAPAPHPPVPLLRGSMHDVGHEVQGGDKGHHGEGRPPELRPGLAVPLGPVSDHQVPHHLPQLLVTELDGKAVGDQELPEVVGGHKKAEEEAAAKKKAEE